MYIRRQLKYGYSLKPFSELEGSLEKDYADMSRSS